MDQSWARTVTVKASWEFAQMSGHDLTQPSIDWDQTKIWVRIQIFSKAFSQAFLFIL